MDFMTFDDCVPCTNTFKFAPLPKAVPCEVMDLGPQYLPRNKQEGKTPMRYNDNYASATVVTATKTDAAVQREYFLNRLDAAEYPKRDEFARLYNLYVESGPKTFKELIDWVKNDKFKINKKVQAKFDERQEEGADTSYWGYGALYGIEWDGPKPDHKGYEAAISELQKQQTTARDTIMSGDAAAMAKAVADFEAWTPTGTAN